jgi:hypothetical protein
MCSSSFSFRFRGASEVAAQGFNQRHGRYELLAAQSRYGAFLFQRHILRRRHLEISDKARPIPVGGDFGCD